MQGSTACSSLQRAMHYCTHGAVCAARSCVMHTAPYCPRCTLVCKAPLLADRATPAQRAITRHRHLLHLAGARALTHSQLPSAQAPHSALLRMHRGKALPTRMRHAQSPFETLPAPSLADATESTEPGSASCLLAAAEKAPAVSGSGSPTWGAGRRRNPRRLLAPPANRRPVRPPTWDGRLFPPAGGGAALLLANQRGEGREEQRKGGETREALEFGSWRRPLLPSRLFRLKTRVEPEGGGLARPRPRA